MKSKDQHEDHEITKVEDNEESWTIFTELGCLCVQKKHGVKPFVGDTARFYGKGFGYPVRGLDLNGVEAYYQTEDEYHEEQAREKQKSDNDRKELANAEKEEKDARVAGLPDCFRKRIERFRRNNPNFYWEYEGYEMTTCVDAVKIAEVMRKEDKPLDALNAYHELPYGEQMTVVEGLDEGHSGNTFGMAVRLAHHYLRDERLVFAEHAAISALVGCECGCPPVTDEEMVAAGYEPFEKEVAS